jgi:hypothetical protein
LLVPKPDLPGAVALQSVQMNLSRVVGPAIGAVIYAAAGAAPVFVINAGTYLFAMVALLAVQCPRHSTVPPGQGVMQRFVGGFQGARLSRAGDRQAGDRRAGDQRGEP